MNYRRILHTLGIVLCFEAVSMILPLICAFIYKESTVIPFVQSILLCLVVGLVLLACKGKSKEIYSKEGLVIVGLSWILMSIFGAFPFVFSKAIPDYIFALFETVSGFTTTGATILKDVEVLPKSILFWRSFTHWIGGMGVLVFLIALLPMSGGSNLFLMKAESPGPTVTKLVPKVKASAKILYYMYIVLTLLQIIFLCFGNMDLFEAITHTFGTAGTGGFGVKNSGLAEYSPYIQIVITVFMILFGINFSVYYLILIKKFKLIFKSSEVKAYLGIIFIAAMIIFINCFKIYDTIGETLRHAFFQVASIITTTGFSTTDFNLWPELSKTILVLLMFIGACAGSTGGGIKVSRIMIFLKSIGKEISQASHPKLVKKTLIDGRPVEHETVRTVNVYMAAYLSVFVASILLISIENFDFTTNFTSVATMINNVGPGLSMVGPMENFSIFSRFSLIVLIFDMLIGRLEIFPLLALFSVYTWKK